MERCQIKIGEFPYARLNIYHYFLVINVQYYD